MFFIIILIIIINISQLEFPFLRLEYYLQYLFIIIFNILDVVVYTEYFDLEVSSRSKPFCGKYS